MKNKQGYIFILTLLMIATATVIGTYIFIRGSIYAPYMRTMIEQEKAKKLALGGLQIAVSQLGYLKPTSVAQVDQQKKPNENDEAKQFLTTILPVINRWQNFPLTEKIDGIQGEINVCLVCEEGKININEIYDFKQHKFKGEKQPQGDWQKIMQDVLKRAEQSVGGKDLFPAFEKFLKKQKYKLNDVTQLLTIKEFAVFKQHVFYEPSAQTRKGKLAVYLTDLFTVSSNESMLEPWLLSDSMLGVLQFKQVEPNEVERRIKSAAGWLKNFKVSAQWNKDWNTSLKVVYGKDIPKTIEFVLNPRFDPKWFSVISYGKVGKVTVRCMAIMERIKRASNGKTGYDVSIRKLYWL